MEAEEAEEAAETQKPKSSKAGLLLSISAASILGAVVFSLTFSGVVLKKTPMQEEVVEEEEIVAEELPEITFLPIEPLLISLGASASGKQLRFEGYLEVNPRYSDEVSQLMPRIMDVLNTYLRAVDYSDVEEPSSLLKMRLQMLRRVQIVVGEGRVNDLLISKFLLS